MSVPAWAPPKGFAERRLLHSPFAITCLKLSYKIVTVSGFIHTFILFLFCGQRENAVSISQSKWSHCLVACTCSSDSSPPRYFTRSQTPFASRSAFAQELINEARGLQNSAYSSTKCTTIVLLKPRCTQSVELCF